VNTQQAFNLAVQHHQSRRLKEAEALYRQILSVEPRHAGALHHLGLIAHQAGRHDLAMEWIRQSLTLVPDNAAAHSDLGEACRLAGRLDDAVACYQRALQLDPAFVAAHYNLGNALLARGRSEEAIVAYHRALHFQPGLPEAWNNLGTALRERQRMEDAEAAFRRAVQLRPEYLEALTNLGAVLASRGCVDEALTVYRRALQLQPGYSQIHLNLGNLFWQAGRRDEATASYRRALELKPDFAEAHYNLGNAFTEQGEFEQAAAAFRHALEIRPGYAEAHNNLGIALVECGRIDDAIGAYRRALELRFDHPETHNNLGVSLMQRGQLDEAIAAFRHALRLKPDRADFHSNLIYTLHAHPAENDGTIAEEHRRWNRQFSEPVRPLIRPHANDRQPGRRLRIGYVSPDFRAGSVAFFLTPLLENHDHRQYEVYCYASVRHPDGVTQRLQKTADVWRDVGALSDQQLAECVRNDGVDILVDLSMHTTGNRLQAFARKPAPVQVSWLAYPGTTGVETMDFRMTDARIDPARSPDDVAGGEPVRLPDAWCCYAPIGEFPLVAPSPAAQNGFVTFGSLNQFSKIHESLLADWAQLLERLPASRLLMICPEGESRERTRAVFAAHGVVGGRVELIARQSWADYVRLFERIDLALDTFPCNGMTTTCHTLWMGVPVITRAGTTAVSRAGRSLLETIGFPEWVADSDEEYIHIAAEWAQDHLRLAETRRVLRSRMEASPLMDAPRFARHVEDAYRTIWKRWCAQKLP